jgi:hypothetical protein
MRGYELPGDNRPFGEVEGRVELRQSGAEQAIVAQGQDQVAAAGRLEPEVGGPEHERLGTTDLHRQPVGDPDLGPATRLPVEGGGQRRGLDPVPEGVLLGAAGDDDQPVAEEAEPAGRPAAQLPAGPEGEADADRGAWL